MQCSSCRRLAVGVLLLCCLYTRPAIGSCPVVDSGSSEFLDPDTPADACTKPACVGSFEQCCGANPTACTASDGPTEQLQLVFSDEFASYEKGVLGTAADPRWTAMDYHYSSDLSEDQNYKPSNVAVKGGKLLLTMEDKESTALRYLPQGPIPVTLNKTSGMLQSWNKFCFTGGYVEFSIKLPGNPKDSGFWAAAWLMGNMGRAGYYPSLEGMWPFSYDACTDGAEPSEWNAFKSQRISRCSGNKGRGAPEIDVLEYGMLGDPPGPPQYVHTMQMAPVAPEGTSWMLPDGSGNIPGITLAGKASFDTRMGGAFRAGSSEQFPRTGSPLTDTYSATSFLKGESYFSNHTKYAVLWEPGEYVRWYLDDQLLFEINKEALRKQTNAAGVTVEQRLISLEPMYIVLNLAMSNKSWAKVSPDLEYPGVMSVDYVRVWQRPDRINVGCDAPGFPTTQYISCNRQLYLGTSEESAWRFPYCVEFKSQENQFLLGVGVSAVAVGLVTVGLMLLMRRSAAAEQKQREKEGYQPANAKPASTQQQKAKYCYINKSGKELEDILKVTRPDLVAAAEARKRQQQT